MGEVRGLVERIESEAATASRSGQHASLTAIAAEVQAALERLANAEAAIERVRAKIAQVHADEHAATYYWSLGVDEIGDALDGDS